MKPMNTEVKVYEVQGQAHCPACTHNVDVKITHKGRQAKVTPGQRCPRCGSSIDAGFVLRYDQAA
jgi:DNA-directed RNA polymerase subunit RPC12/RpoP